MATEYKLSYTAEEIDKRLGKVGEAVTCSKQTLTPEQQAQARENIGTLSSAEVTAIVDSKLSSITNAEEVAY